MPDSSPEAAAFPQPTFRGSFPVSGGESRALARWDIDPARGRVVLSHGYGEHGERYAHTAKWLNGLGWSVSALDHRGFGRSPGIRGDGDGLLPFVEDLAACLDLERPPGLPLLVLGHSFGGLVALAAALAHPKSMAGLILSSPALVLRPYPRSVRLLRGLLLRLAPHLSLDLPNNKDLVCSDPELVQRYWADPLCHRRVTAAFTQLFQEGYDWILPRAAGLSVPTLVLDAGADTVADPAGADPIWARVPSEFLERHRLEGFLHEVFHDRRRAEAQDLAAAWIVRRFPGNPGGDPLMRG